MFDLHFTKVSNILYLSPWEGRDLGQLEAKEAGGVGTLLVRLGQVGRQLTRWTVRPRDVAWWSLLRRRGQVLHKERCWVLIRLVPLCLLF